MTTSPADIPAPDTTAVDQQLLERAQSHGEYLAGLIAAGTLDTVGRPDKLPTALFPDVDPWIVDDIWKRALAVGVWVGKAMARPQWDQAALDRLRTALAEAGYEGMARTAARTAAVHPRRPLPPSGTRSNDPALPTPRHPADHDTPRGGHQ